MSSRSRGIWLHHAEQTMADLTEKVKYLTPKSPSLAALEN